MDTAQCSPVADETVARANEHGDRNSADLANGVEVMLSRSLAREPQEPLHNEPLADVSEDVDSDGEDDIDSLGDDDGVLKHSSPSDSQQATGLSGLSGQGNLAGSKQLTSRFRGVCWNKKNKRWQAAINTQGKYLYLGSYTSEEQAARAFDLAAVKLRGPRAKLNFVYSDYIDKDGNLIDEAKLDLLTGGNKDGVPKKVIRRRRPRTRRNPPNAPSNVSSQQILSLLGMAGDMPNSNKPSGSRMAEQLHDTAAQQHDLLQKAALLLTLASGSNSAASLQSQLSADPGMAKTLSGLGDILRNLGGNPHHNDHHAHSQLIGSLGGSSSISGLSSSGHNLQPLLLHQHQQQQQQQQQHHHHQVVDLHRHMMHVSNPSPQSNQSHDTLMMHSAPRGTSSASSMSHGTGQLAISSIEALLPNSLGDMQCLIYRSSHCSDRLSCAVISANGVHELGAYDSLADAQQAGLATMKLLEKLGRASGGAVGTSGRMSLEQQQLEAAHQGLGGGRTLSGSGGMVQLSLLHGAAGGRASPDISRASPKLLMLAAQAQQQNSLSGLLAGYDGGLMREQEHQDSGPMQSYNDLLLSHSGRGENQALSWGLQHVSGQKRRYTWEEENQAEAKRMASHNRHAQLEGQQLLSVVLGGGNNSRGVQDVVQSLLQQASLLQTAPSQA